MKKDVLVRTANQDGTGKDKIKWHQMKTKVVQFSTCRLFLLSTHTVMRDVSCCVLLILHQSFFETENYNVNLKQSYFV